MKHISIILVAVRGGLLATGILITLFYAAGWWLNYREFGAVEVLEVWAASFLLLYLLSIYVIAILLYQRYSNRMRTLESSKKKRRILLRSIVPVFLILSLVMMNRNVFLNVFAPAEVRQRRAYKEFADYRYAVDDIQNCQPIQARIGNIKTIAPTRGQNVTVRDPGSSGHRGEFTLEVIGDKGTGIANSSFHISTRLYIVKFTYKGKSEMLTCDNAGTKMQS